jgi:hypothetical protein
VAVIGTVAIAAAVASASPTVRATESSHGCGHERWSVKTLMDSPGKSLDLTKQPVKTTVEELRRLKVPTTWTQSAPRIGPVEKTLYRVTALLMSMKREKDDSDIHLVIADPRVGGSMIVEFPASTCNQDATPAARKLMLDARKAFTNACGGEPGTNFVTLSGKATLVGVGFFDALHKQGGLAPNGIELHPVIGVEAVTCKRVQNP